MQETLEDWFRREILIHEAALVRFLARNWFNHNDVQDLRHDIYVRVQEGAERKLPHSPRAFLFGVARHLLIDRVRRERIVAGVNNILDKEPPLVSLNISTNYFNTVDGYYDMLGRFLHLSATMKF